MIIHGIGHVGTGGGGSPPPVPTATTFSVALSATSGTVGTTQTVSVTPVSGNWPTGVSVALMVSGVPFAASPDTRSPSGTAAAVFSFTPSGAGTASVNATATGMTSTGAQSYTASAVVIPPTAGNANRFDVVFAQSAVAPGGSVTGKVIPNGNMAGGNVTIATGSSTVTVALASSGNAPVSFSLPAPSAEGEYSYTVTNTAGLFNPYPPPLTVFASGNGTATTITASLTRTDFARFQRDTPSGNPAGFSASWARGWGEVWFSLNVAGSALFARLYDSASSGATTTVGTGTALSGIVQVHGTFASGTVRALLPAGPYQYWVDLATDAAFTNPVRVAQRFGIGAVVGDMSRSQETGFVNPYADNTAFPAIYSKLSVMYSGDPRYPQPSANWAISSDTSAGQEFARIFEAQLGVIVGITGVSATGGGLDYFFNHDGTTGTSYGSPFDATVGLSCGKKFRYSTWSMGGWDGTDSTNYPNESYAEDQSRLQAAIARFPTTYPACAVMRVGMGMPSGWFGSDGSAPMGYVRLTKIIRDLEGTNPLVVAGASTLWNEFVGGHASQGARPDYARTAARMMLSVEPAAMGGLGTSNRGALLAATGALSGRIVRIAYDKQGGANLVALKASYTNPTVAYGTATTAQLASVFSIYAGAGARQGSGPAVKIDSATINTGLGTIDLALNGTAGLVFADGTTAAMPSALTVHYGADYGASNATLGPAYSTSNPVGASLADDTVEWGIPYGRLMRPAIDIAVTTS